MKFQKGLLILDVFFVGLDPKIVQFPVWKCERKDVLKERNRSTRMKFWDLVGSWLASNCNSSCICFRCSFFARRETEIIPFFEDVQT